MDNHATGGKIYIFLHLHLIAAVISSKRVMLGVNSKVNMTEKSTKDNLMKKQIMTKFNVGKTQGYAIFDAKSEMW